MNRTRLAIGLLAALVMSLSYIWFDQTNEASAQSGSRNSSRYQSGSGTRVPVGSVQSNGSSTRMVQKSYEARFWDWMKDVQYRNWGPAPGQGAAAYEGQSPHGDFLKMYLNRTALTNPANPPDGSIIIKENYTTDGKTLAAVTVMYKVKDFHPEHGDWYWVKYNADGSVARTPPEKGSRRIAGKFTGCIECHAAAKGGDYVFFNDE